MLWVSSLILCPVLFFWPFLENGCAIWLFSRVYSTHLPLFNKLFYYVGVSTTVRAHLRPRFAWVSPLLTWKPPPSSILNKQPIWHKCHTCQRVHVSTSATACLFLSCQKIEEWSVHNFNLKWSVHYLNLCIVFSVWKKGTFSSESVFFGTFTYQVKDSNWTHIWQVIAHCVSYSILHSLLNLIKWKIQTGRTFDRLWA